MLPKNSKHYIIPTAEKLNTSPTLVEDVISFYFSELRKTLSNLSFQTIKVENFGSFKAKEKELSKLNIKYTKHLNALNEDNEKYKKIKEDLDSKLSKVVTLQNLIKEEKQKKYEFNLIKHGNNSKDNQV
jgi:nucleoid DNA-binding protein